MLNLTKTRTCNESSSSYHLHTELVQTKFSMGTLLHLDNHHQFFGSRLIVWFYVSGLSLIPQLISTRFSRSVSDISLR